MKAKKQYKTYKAKNHWVNVPILFLSVLGAVGLATNNVQAAELDTQPETISIQSDNHNSQTVSETTVQKDTTSQPTKVEEVASEKNGAEQSSATPNDTTNVQQPTVGAEKSAAQEQPVVSPEATNEPLGQPTEVAPTENDANKSTTIPKEFETPDVDKAVDEAKKDPNITVVEKPVEDLGNVSSKDLATKEKEVAEYNKHKNENSYVNEAISKNLVFDQSVVTKDTKISSIKGGKFIKATDFNKVNAGDSKDIFTKLRKDMGGKATGNFQNSFVKEVNLGANGGYAVLLEKNKPVTVTYTGLNASYLGRKITKAEFVYELQSSPSQSGTLNAVFSNDPIITAFIGTNRVNGKDVKTRLTIKFFDASGKEVLPDKDSPFAYALSSLNSSLTNKGGHAEFVSNFRANNTFKYINGSYVKKQADGKFYSPEDIDYGTGPSGLKNSDWDAVGHKNAYFGSGVGLANGRISFSFGMTTKGKSNVPVSSAQWFAFSTNLNAKSVTPKRQFNSPKEPEKATIEFNGYKANVV
ncbi:GbpC/Spa domain-containing protein, partial [Enterococcus faecalis]|uniref:GbpC/Spa domain-containing protein n=1 Tax=Enterococcus faecalis TaxID=1351 RepID=UPI003CC5F4C2